MKIIQSNYQQSNKYGSASFRALDFLDFNGKFNSKKNILMQETRRFIQNRDNAEKIGEGISGKTYRFTNSLLSNVVIKENKEQSLDNYQREYDNLKSIPTNKIGGQEAIARAYSNGKYYLISTLVSGKTASMNNKYSELHLRNLFKKMFELDKQGIYHGDLNGKNILLNDAGEVNFIDYQWTERVNIANFFDNTKSQQLLLPLFVFPENAQMLEMASLPYYIENLERNEDKENFLKTYLKEKSEYHKQRYSYIKKITARWKYRDELPTIKDSLDSEYAKAKLYENPDDEIIRLELKKFQFLSDYRDAYAHVDPNLPDRNILPSTSSYLCAISAVQDFRKEVYNQTLKCSDGDKKKYLSSMEKYGSYWYNNLINYSLNTFNYVMRAVTKTLNDGEEKHHFYINNRNPRYFAPNRDLLAQLRPDLRTKYEQTLDTAFFDNKLLYYSEVPLNSGILDTKSEEKFSKIRQIAQKAADFTSNGKILDLLNASQLAVLKLREARGYVKHNLSKQALNNFITQAVENTANYTENLFQSVYDGLLAVNAKNIIVKGYENMRAFKLKI